MTIFIIGTGLFSFAALAAIHELVWIGLTRAGLTAPDWTPPPAPVGSVPGRAAALAATAASDGTLEGV